MIIYYTEKYNDNLFKIIDAHIPRDLYYDLDIHTFNRIVDKMVEYDRDIIMQDYTKEDYTRLREFAYNRIYEYLSIPKECKLVFKYNDTVKVYNNNKYLYTKDISDNSYCKACRNIYLNNYNCMINMGAIPESSIYIYRNSLHHNFNICIKELYEEGYIDLLDTIEDRIDLVHSICLELSELNINNLYKCNIHIPDNILDKLKLAILCCTLDELGYQDEIDNVDTVKITYAMYNDIPELSEIIITLLSGEQINIHEFTDETREYIMSINRLYGGPILIFKQ